MDIFILKFISTSLGGLSALLLFFFGIPAMTKSDTVTGLAVNTPETNIKDKKNKQKFKVYNFISKLALLMLLGSFSMQLVILFIEK